MKKTFLLALIVLISIKTFTQNADEIIFSQYKQKYNYIGASFVIDSGTSQNNTQKRAFLIWANNLSKDSLIRNISLSEYNPNLDFLTEQGASGEISGSARTMFPKKIIESKFERAYYLLSYVKNSGHLINGFKVYSSPAVYKIDANTLSVIWAKKINLSAININNVKTVIEYNDMIETADKNIVLVGKYATNIQSKEYVLATKLHGASGNLLWRYTYITGFNCNEAANSVAETNDGNLSLTGYVKKCSGQSLNGATDVFYMQLQPTGIPVAGIYARYVWPFSLNIWGDKITCYTSSAGNDRLIISGYVDVQNNSGAVDRQILIMNLQQNGNLITAQHVGDSKKDVCNDLIFNRSGNDYLIYLTGQTDNKIQDSASSAAYFMYAGFSAAAGITSLQEFSTFPITVALYNNYKSRMGIEIKNAGDFKKFAILATGVYQPKANVFQTYTNVLIRDFGDATGNCIKKQKPPVTQFNIDKTFVTLQFSTPLLEVYKEDWQKLSKLTVEELCQKIEIDPSYSSNKKAGNPSLPFTQSLQVSPNPAQNTITVSTADGTTLTGHYDNAELRIFNYTMQAEKTVRVVLSNNKAIKISVNDLHPGIYRVQLTRGNEMLGCSFVKE